MLFRSRFIAHTGHPEYNATRLAFEAKRDLDDPEVEPPENFDFDNPKNRWRSHRNNFFMQWIRYCYLSISTSDMSNGESLRNRGRVDLEPEILE